MLAAAGTMSLARSREHAQQTGASTTVASIIKDAQSRSVTAMDGKAWGVRCQNDTVIMFAYTATQPELTPESYVLPNGVNCTIGAGDVRFEKLTGLPDGADSITLFTGVGTVSRVEVTSSGAISEE